MPRPIKGAIVLDGVVVGRVCSRCGQPKAGSEFGRDSRNSTGLQSWCKQCIAERQAERVKQDPVERARRNEQARKWARAHPSNTASQRQARYRERYPDRPKARAEVAYHLREKILAVFNRCMACGADQDLTIDHVIALGQAGATNDPSNLQVLCRSCNSAKADRTIDYRTDAQRTLLTRLP